MSVELGRVGAHETAGAAPAAQQDADRRQIRQLAQQFEALLMSQMLREMRRSMLSDDDEKDGLGAGALMETGDGMLAGALSQSGGVGLADVLLRAFERQFGLHTTGPDATRGQDAGAASPDSGPSDAAAPGAQGAPALLRDVASSAPVSSGFGWRADPFTGAPRFHAGVDLAVAYGRDVRAAAAGTVVFSGVQGGYGNTVVIDHGDGRQTRYAHLSEQLVRAGDAVTGGQVVGKAGDSGRATGPHLHFEVLVGGQPVDPAAAAEP
jgi:murein DD-endopeptidase MepM/ murein hydrolase activator NlpD